MKKLLTAMLIAVLAISGLSLLSACADKGSEIAMVSDLGTVDDKSFNEGAWTAIKTYAEANKKTYAYYQPAEDTTDSRVATIKQAIDNGAKIVVCPGYLFERAIYKIQNDYPEVSFLLLDGEPHDEHNNYFTTENVHCILYREEQAGYLAGYAAVKDGFRDLGFLGGVAVPAVKRFGYGYVQGAEAAAASLGLAPGATEIKFWFSGSFVQSDQIRDKMAAWYADGTEIIFSCGGAIFKSVLSAAESFDGAKIIGVDIDQSGESRRILTSAVKGIARSVELSLTAYYDNGGKWSHQRAGKTALLGAAEECIALPTDDGAWRFSVFTKAEYETLLAALKSGETNVSNDSAAAPATTLVAVDYQN